nr:mobile mystery protein B [Pararhizobium antarcticum]
MLKFDPGTKASNSQKSLNSHSCTKADGNPCPSAGTFRTTEHNIGVESYRIGIDLANLLCDVLYWVENDTFPKDEIAVRFHHRLVAIHPLPTGNGRHARLAADILIERLGGQRFSWGGGTLADVGELRARYVAALRAADNHDIAPLRDFART